MSRQALAPVAALLLSVAILLMGNGLQGTLLPVRASLEDFATLSIGIMGSLYYLGFAAGCVLGPYLLRHVGHIRSFTAMAAVASAVPLVHGLILLAPAWWLMRALTGFCFAVLYLIIESWLNERSTNETRGMILSLYLIINLTVITLGQLMLVLADPAEFPLFAIASILVSLAAVPVALTSSAQPAPVQTVKIRIGRLYRTSPVGFMGCFFVGLSNGSFWALGPVFAGASGLDITGIAVFMSVTVLGGALGQWPLGRLSDRTDRRRVLFAGSVLAAAIGAAVVASGMATPGWPLFLLGLAWGACAFPLYAIAVAHSNDYADAREFVEVSGGLLLVSAVGSVTGPVLASLLMGPLGGTGLFAFTAASHLMLAVFALWRMRQRPPPPPDEQVEFTDALAGAETLLLGNEPPPRA